eukprot:6175591-Pleurochrysis_carterae.AAC.1
MLSAQSHHQFHRVAFSVAIPSPLEEKLPGGAGIAHRVRRTRMVRTAVLPHWHLTPDPRLAASGLSV